MSIVPRSAEEKRDWLRLIRTENVGPVTFFQLMNQFGSAAEALARIPELAEKGGMRRKLGLCSLDDANREFDAIQKKNIHLIAWGEPQYPDLLKHISDAPPLLMVMGNPALLKRPSVGVVGARNASANGRRLTSLIAQRLGTAGYVVTSGLARGIDTCAHEGALGTGTVAVVAGGVDDIYPPENEKLYHRIAEEGAIVSEGPLGLKPQAKHFPRRNRIISGMSLGVAVIEASLHSGSLITATYALDQGREVFAVPGSPLDPRAHGTNKLIREGAVLLSSAEDIITSFAQRKSSLLESPGPGYKGQFRGIPDTILDRARQDISVLLNVNPVAIDEIVRLCDLSTAVVMTVLLELELAGKVERHVGGRVSALMDPMLLENSA